MANKKMRLEIRHAALNMAIRQCGRDAAPEQIVRVARQFEEYLNEPQGPKIVVPTNGQPTN